MYGIIGFAQDVHVSSRRPDLLPEGGKSGLDLSLRRDVGDPDQFDHTQRVMTILWQRQQQLIEEGRARGTNATEES
jgi:hypothetical protein